jgi:hypothetical protein
MVEYDRSKCPVSIVASLEKGCVLPLLYCSPSQLFDKHSNGEIERQSVHNEEVHFRTFNLKFIETTFHYFPS